MASSKVWLIAGGVAVLAGVAYVAKYHAPADDLLAGSVAPAERYRADIKPTDLATPPPLGDQTIPQFMQTDIYHQIVTDKAVAAAFASDAFRDAFASQALRDAFANQAFRDAFASQAF